MSLRAWIINIIFWFVGALILTGYTAALLAERGL